jgi:hypothetical protein
MELNTANKNKNKKGAKQKYEKPNPNNAICNIGISPD